MKKIWQRNQTNGPREISINGKPQGYPLVTAAYNALRAGNSTTTNTTLQTSNTTAPTSKTKLEEDAYLSWR